LARNIQVGGRTHAMAPNHAKATPRCLRGYRKWTQGNVVSFYRESYRHALAQAKKLTQISRNGDPAFACQCGLHGYPPKMLRSNTII
jgi:hypothetical protein